MAIEKELKLIFAIVKDQNKYQLEKINKELVSFFEVMQKLEKYSDIKIKVRVDGVKELVEMKNAIVSLNRFLPGVTSNLSKFTSSLSAFKNIDVAKAVELQAALNKLTDSISKFNIRTLQSDLDGLTKVITTFADRIQRAIAPTRDFENAIGSLDKRIEASISSFKRFSDIVVLLQNATSGVANATQNVKTPTLKTKESEVLSLVGQYNKLVTQLDRTSQSIKKFNELSAKGNIDSGTRKQALNDIKQFKSAYDSLGGVVGRLVSEFDILSKSDPTGNLTQTLGNVVSEAVNKQDQYTASIDKTRQAEVLLENQNRKLREEYKSQFNTLKGVLERQTEFLAGAAVLAATGNTIRSGFKAAFDTLNQVQTILTVSRSNFLDTAQTAKVLSNTLDEFAIKTGSSAKEVGTVLKEFGSAGLTTEQSIAALNSTLNNIIGTNASVVETTRLVASTYNILGNSIASTSDQVANFTRINDVFARATNESSLELDQLVQALKFSLPASKESGLNLEELTGILGQLADQGLRGGNAGRALRSVLQQLSKDTEKVAKALDLKIDLSKPLDLLTIIRQYGEQIRGQDISVEQLGTIFERFGLRGADVFLLLAQNIDKVNSKIKDLKENSEGTAETAANLKLNTPERQFAIFSENLARLSREVLKPLIDLFLVLVTTLNKVAESINMLSDNSIAKMALRIATATIALKAFATTFKFVTGIQFVQKFIELSNGASVVSSSLSTASKFVGNFGLTLSRFLPIIGYVSLAIAGLATAYNLFASNNKIVIKEIDDQIKKFSETLSETRKLRESYFSISEAVIKAKKDFDQGNITQEEYRNTLNSIAQQTPQVADIIFKYGENAEEAAEKLKLLAKEQERIAQQQRDLIQTENIKKFQFQAKEAEELIKKYKQLTSEVGSYENVLENVRKNPGVINRSEASIREDIATLNASRKEVQIEINKYISDITSFAYQTTDKVVEQQALAIVRRLKSVFGDLKNVTGLGTDFTRLPDVISDMDEKIKNFSAKKFVFEVEQLKNNVTDATRGFEGFRNSLLFQFDTIIEKDDIQKLNDKLENVGEVVAKQQKEVGRRFINELNFDGLAQELQTQFNAAGINAFKFDGLRQSLFEAIDIGSDKGQLESILKNFDAIYERQIKGLEKVRDEEIKKGRNSFDAEEEFSAKRKRLEEGRESVIKRIQTLESNISQRRELQLKAGELQSKQEIINAARAELYNAAIKEAGTIRRDVVKSIEAEIRLDREQIATIDAENKDLEKIKKTRELTAEQEKKLNENLKTRVVVTKKEAQDTETRRKLIFEINTNLKKARLELQNAQGIGTSLLDQEEQRKKLIDLELDALNQRNEVGENAKIVETEILKLKKEKLDIDRASGIFNENAFKTLFGIQSELGEILSKDQSRQKILSNIKEAQLGILLLSKDLNNLLKIGNGTEKQQLETRIKLSQLIVQLVKSYKDLGDLQKKEIDNALRLLELRNNYNKALQSVSSELSSRAEGPLRKLLEKFFDTNSFSGILTFVRSIGGGFDEITAYLNDNNAAVDRFFEELRKGNVDLSEYPERIRELAEVYQTAESNLKNLREVQNQINDQKFAVLEKSFSQAIKKGGQEGYEQAIDVLEKLISISEVLNVQTGQRDIAATERNLETIRELSEQLQTIDTQAKSNPLQGLIDGTGIAKKEFEALNEVMLKVLDTIRSLNAEGTAVGTNEKLREFVGTQIKRASGGLIPGKGNSDSVPALLTPGEYVIPKDVVTKLGTDYFNNLVANQSVSRFAEGGEVGGTKVKVGAFEYSSSGSDNSGLITAITISNNSLITIIGKMDQLNTTVSEELDSLYKLTNAGFQQEIPQNIEKITGLLNKILNEINSQKNILKVIAGAVDPSFTLGGFATGGFVPGSGSGDIIPALLEPGEFVIPKKIVKKLGSDYFEKLNDIQRFADGGSAGGSIGRTISNLTPFTSDLPGNQQSKTEKELEQNNKQISELNNYMKELTSAIQELIKGIQKQNEELKKSNDLVESRRSIAPKNTELEKQENIVNKANTKKSQDKPLPFSANFEVVMNDLNTLIDAYIKNVKNAGQSTNNFFLKFAARSADRFLSKIEEIGDAFQDLFSNKLPSFLTFFLQDILQANADILTDYEKTKQEIVKTYKDQRDDLIEQLKRNEISYFDFFDKLEDLQKNRNEDEIKAEKEKDKALQEQLRKNLVDISETVSNIIKGTISSVADFISGIPAFVNPFIDKITAAISKIGGGVGEVLGGIAGVVGPIAGFAIGAASQFFSFILQGFANMIPVITNLLLQPTEDLKLQLESIKAIPEEINKNVAFVKDNIKEILKTFVDEGALRDIGVSFANAIKETFPLIAQAMPPIIIESFRALSPIIAAVFDTLPDMFLAVFASSTALVDLVYNVLRDAGLEFLNFFTDNLPRLDDILRNTFETLFNTGTITQFSQNIQSAGKAIVESVIESSPAITEAFIQASPGIATGIANALPDVINSAIGSVSNLSSGPDNPIFKLIENFIDGAVKKIPDLINRIPEVIDKVFSLIFTGSIFLRNINDMLGVLIKTVIAKIPELGREIIDNLIKILPKLITSGIGFISNIFQEAFKKDFSKVLNEIGSNFSRIAQTFGLLFDTLSRIFQSGTLQKAFESVNALFEELGSILLEIFVVALEDTLDVMNELTKVFADVFAEIINELVSSGAMDELVALLAEMSKYIAEVLRELLPLVRIVLPYLAPALKILIIAGFIPLIAILGTLLVVVLAVVAVIIVLQKTIEAVNIVMEKMTEAFNIFKNVFGQFIDDFNSKVDAFVETKNRLIEEFNNFINGIIDSIPGAREAINARNQQNSEGENKGFVEGAKEAANTVIGGITQATGINIPRFYRGGLVRGRSGRDNIDIKATAGEFIIPKDVVDQYGQKFFANLISSPTTLAGFSLAGGMDNTRVPFEDTLNANTRDYYLDNYYSSNGPSQPVSDSGTTFTNRGYAPTNPTLGGEPSSTSSTGQNGTMNITVNLDLSGSHFNSEDAAQKVTQTIIESLNNDQGELAQYFRDLKKKD